MGDIYKGRGVDENSRSVEIRGEQLTKISEVLAMRREELTKIHEVWSENKKKIKKAYKCIKKDTEAKNHLSFLFLFYNKGEISPKF